MKQVRLRVPATSGNMGPAFDVLGVALKLYNKIYLEIDRVKRKGKIKTLDIEIKGEGRDILSLNRSNLVYRAAKKVFDRLNIAPSYLCLKIHNKIPLARGLGSSASAIVGGMKAANVIGGNRIGDRELLRMAVDMEGHPDNVVPAFYGDVCLAIREKGGLHFHKIPFPKGKEPFFVVSVPDFELSTVEARRVLPSRDKKDIKYKDHLDGMAHVAWLVAEILRRKEGRDKIFSPIDDRWYHQPYRKRLIPGMEEVFRAAKRAGAFGAALSGAGPSIIALAEKSGRDWRRKGEKIGRAMDKEFVRHRHKGKRISAQHLILEIDKQGCRKI